MAPVMDGEAAEDDSLACNRSRRTKKDKGGRLAALQRLKQAKASGEKVKYEVTEEKSVYEEVDEREYSKIVQDRQEDDWIVDDDGSGYVEDGRDIFDDEDRDAGATSAKGKKGEKRKAQNPNIRAPGSKPKSIRSMFAAAAVKSKPKVEKDINLNEDDLLGDIMAELKQENTTNFMPPAVKLKKKPLSASKANPFSTKVLPPKEPSATAAKPVTPKTANSAPPVEEQQQTPPPPPIRRLKPPRAAPMFKTALDGLGNGDSGLSQEIDEFSTQEVAAQTRPSQNIEEDKEVDSSAVDVSGIDFDEDFGMDSQSSVNGHGAIDIDASENELDNSLTMPKLGSQWETVKGEEQPDLPTDVKVDSSKLPLTTNENGDEVLRMFWLDAYEDHYKQPGVVYLFGKVWVESAKAHVSCCVAVKNIERRIYLLPRKTKFDMKSGKDTEKPVTFLDVYQEFNERISEKYKIMKYKSKKSTKQYAFEIEDVPAESDYLEVQYSAEYPTLPSDLKGETFYHVFGTNTSSLELFLLDRKLKGPGWIDISMPQLPHPQVSWCRVEAFVSRPDYVTVIQTQIPAPPLVVMTLNLRTLPNPKTHQNEVVAAACLVQHMFYMDKPAPKPLFQQHFVAVTKPNDCVFPFDFKDKAQQQGKAMKVEIIGSERALLAFLLAKINKVDPDLIVGHDIFGFDLDVLLHRIQQSKTPHWSRLGRLKRANMPKLSSLGGAKGSSAGSACSGRLVCDVKISARELMRCRSYDLTELVSTILKDKRSEVDLDQIRSIYNHSNHLLQLLEWTLVDSRFILRLMYELNVIPLALQITNICGNIMPRTLMGGRAERNEYLLLHAFTEKNFIPPDKQYGRRQKVQHQQTGEEEGEEDHQAQNAKKGGRRKPAYTGGLVLDPKKGFYDKFILLLDFNSLYPSIIQEYNICFTTITRAQDGQNTQDGGDDDMNVQLPEPDLEPGVLPTEIRKLVQSRRQVKQLMKNPDLAPEVHMQYDIRQKALKLTANSMYGCLGFTFSRFYAKPLAALVTGKGREILMKTKDLVQNMNLDVIYGDTDSIMVNTNSTDIETVFKLGNKVKTEVNKLYKLLEIDIDGVFKSMLLLKKKKYAALTVTKVGDKYVTAQELKGLDIVRRDWCELAKEAGNFVVSQILSGESRELIVENIHSKLIEVAQKVNEGSVPVEMYQITRQLTKNPEDYPDKKSLPHVQVALRMNSKGGRQLRSGDTVFYIVCEDGSNLSHSQRAYHPDELAKREDLKIDTKYYLASQVHPVVARLCDPIDGTDAAHIAECLGLDPSGYRHALQMQESSEDYALLAGGQTSEEEKYKDCDRFKMSCPECCKEIIFDGVFVGASDFMECSLSKCPNPECTNAPYNYIPRLQNQLTVAIRGHLKKYYEGWLKCEDTACGARVRKMPLNFNRGHPVCHLCMKGILHAEYSDSALYTQLSFYQYIFDLDKALGQLSEKEHRNINIKTAKETYGSFYHKLKSHISRHIRQSAYSEVNLSRLFDGLFTLK